MNYLKHLETQYDRNTFRRKVDYVKHNLGTLIGRLNAGDGVLEIGPGLGECVSYLNSQNIKNIDIIDNSTDVLSLVQREFTIRKAIRGFAENVSSMKLGKYKLIVMIQVLEHIKIDKQINLIKSLYSRLEKGGTIFIVVPNANNPLSSPERYGDYQHTSAFTTQSLKDLVEQTGIKGYELGIDGYKIPPFSTINKIRILMQRILHLVILILLIANGGVYFQPLTPNITLTITKK